LNHAFARITGNTTMIEQHQNDAEDLADEPVGRQARAQRPHPDVFGQVHVVQRRELVNVPELERAEEVPVRARRNVPSTMSDDQRTANPNRKIVISARRSLKV
jgi:hypothetical protein